MKKKEKPIKKGKSKEKDIEIRERYEEEKEEESGLEEEVLEEDSIDQPRLQSFLRSSKAPVLEKVAETAQVRTIFRTNQSNNSNSDNNDESNGDSVKYISSGGNKDEPKYIDSSSHIKVNPNFVDPSKLGREKFEPQRQAFSEEASEMQQRGFSSSNVEKYSLPERFDPSQEGRGDPLKREMKKYQPKLPGG